jgi:5'-3' exonuclease
MNFVLIDGSYYIFYRYYALLVWWKHSHKDLELNEQHKPFENQEFIDKFKKTFATKINEIDKKLNLKNTIKMVARDCSRDTIWRKSIYNGYKENRNTDFLGKEFFKMVYNEHLFENSGVNTILHYPELEADDCIAITTKHIRSRFPDANIWIIASDMDYLQLASEKVSIINLKYQDISKSTHATKRGADCDKFCKIVCGDKSDNIQGIFEKCGIKTAIKLFENSELFYKKLNQSSEYLDKYELNKKLIDFNEIPHHLIQGFKQQILYITE